MPEIAQPEAGQFRRVARGSGFRFVPVLWVPLDKNEGPCQAKSVLDDVEASLSVTVSLRTKTLSIFT